MERIPTYGGQKFGWYTIIKDAPDRIYIRKDGSINRGRFVFAECRCGVVKEISLRALKQGGENYSCRKCSGKQRTIKKSHRKFDLKDRYGDWKVLHIYKCIKWRSSCLCECKCGKKVFVEVCGLKRGHTSKCIECSDAFTVKMHKKEVVEIRRRLKNGERMIKISKELNIPYHRVKAIKEGKAKHHKYSD